MSMVRVHISVSADGYVAGPNQSEENPLGDEGERLHDWVVVLRAWRAPHGLEGGEANASNAVVEEAQANIGAESGSRPIDETRPAQPAFSQKAPVSGP